MKIFRVAIFLGVLSSTLIGCDNGDKPEPQPVYHTLAFNGKNCSMKNPSGEDITSIKVKDGASASYIISTDTSKYKMPNIVSVEGTVGSYKFDEYYGTLSIENITSDVIVSATAIGIHEYSVSYAPQTEKAGFEWLNPHPETVKENTLLTVGLKAKAGYELTKDNITVQIGTIKKFTDFTYTNNTLAIDGKHVNGNIYISPEPTQPVPPVGNYEFTLTLTNAINDPTEYPFPKNGPQSRGVSLFGEFAVKKGYRAPTKQELIESQAIVKTGPGVIHPFVDEDFSYRTYEIENPNYDNGGYIYIPYFGEIVNADTISITINPIPLVQVTFKPGEGHWADGTEGDKVASIDKGRAFEVAQEKAKADVTIDDPAKRFKVWVDDKQTEIWSPTIINNDTTVTAIFENKTFSINTAAIKNASTNLPENVLYHQGVSGTITANADCKLPDREDIEVWHGLRGSGGTEITDQVTYTLNGDSTSAVFAIPENIINDNIYIYIEAYKEISVTFSPGEGKWRAGGSDAKTVVVRSGATYQEALYRADVDGNPIKDGGYSFEGWYNGTEKIMDMTEKVYNSVSLVARYTQDSPDFSTDSWANIIKYSELGYEALSKRYGATMYLGVNRTLHYKSPYSNIDVVDYDVRLIDYDGHDTISGTSKKATLTFEFVNLIGEGSYGVNAPTNATGNNKWSTSSYRKFLSDFYSILSGNDPDTEQPLNPGFAAKKVTKATKRVDVPAEGEPSWTTEYTDDYLFPLSGSEIGINGKNHQLNFVTYNGGEGEMYDYYWYNTRQGADYSPMAKKYANSTTTKATDIYWLRSPHTKSEGAGTEGDPDTSGAFYIDYVDVYPGSVPEYHGIDFKRATGDYGYGYTAAFCI